jgi:hypothetical protein
LAATGAGAEAACMRRASCWLTSNRGADERGCGTGL